MPSSWIAALWVADGPGEGGGGGERGNVTGGGGGSVEMLLDLSYTCVEWSISQLFLNSNSSGTTAIISLLYTAHCVYIRTAWGSCPEVLTAACHLCTYVYY